MKKTFFYLIALSFFLCLSATAQWEYSNPQPSGFGNSKVVFVNQDTGFVFNINGDLIQTTNGGTNWRIIKHFPSAVTLEIKDSTGIISDYQGLFISSDNGSTWNRKSDLKSVIRVHIASRDSLFAVTTMNGLGEELYKSVDRGLTWQKITLPVNTLKGETFLNSKTGFICSHTGIFRSTDAGISWHLVDSTYNTAQPAPIRFADTKNGFVYNSSGMLRTTDGGTTWTNSPGVFQRINDVFYLNPQTAFAASFDGVVFKTIDGGVSWVPYDASIASYAYGLYSLYFLNQNKGFAVGSRGRILKTTNGGTTWEGYAPSYIDVMGLSMPTANVGYAITWYDLLKTTDAGKSWDTIGYNRHEVDGFRFVHFFNADTGIVIHDQPLRVHKTNNGGVTWDTTDLWSLGFSHYSYYTSCYAVGSTLYLMATGGSSNGWFRSTDYGETWEVLLNVSNYKNLHFVTEKTGYATTTTSLFKTADSGRTWNKIPLVDYNFLNSIWFTDEKTGFVAGDNAFLIRTQDSGKTWNRITINNNNNGYDIVKARFFNAGLGYLTQETGGVLVTADSGRSWLSHGRPSNFELNHIEFSKDSAIYLAGIYGAIVKRKIATHQIDSFVIQSNAGCSLNLSARVTAILSTVDSIFFEYGVTGYTDVIKASPASVENISAKTTGILQGLQANTKYKFRVKVYYQGGSHYSDSLTFTTGVTAAKPVITASGNVLRSSAGTGNQWYLNGAPITGATSQQYVVAAAGTYTVLVTQNDCTARSDDYRFVANHQIDSFLLYFNSSCQLTLSARVTAILSTVDSIFFEYGITGYTNVVKASPASVQNTNAKVNGNVGALQASSNYRFRVKVYYQGNIYYSDSLTFQTGVTVTKPVITATGNVLRSSATTGNQWYLNGVAINGATNQQHTVTAAGIYTVSFTKDDCTDMSDEYSFLTTGITDPAVWNNEVMIYPNPVNSALKITNTGNRSLFIRLVDVHGRTVYHAATSTSHNINMQPLTRGSYLLLITDRKKNETLTKLVIKE